jgi:hypothetical protein
MEQELANRQVRTRVPVENLDDFIVEARQPVAQVAEVTPSSRAASSVRE